MMVSDKLILGEQARCSKKKSAFYNGRFAARPTNNETSEKNMEIAPCAACNSQFAMNKNFYFLLLDTTTFSNVLPFSLGHDMHSKCYLDKTSTNDVDRPF
jgi:hypothetical protein